MMTKEILIQYSDLQEEIKETRKRIEKIENQLKRMESDGTVFDKVMGGAGGIQPFKIEGFPYPEYTRKKTLLSARKAILADFEAELFKTLSEVEQFITSIKDSRMRRIITLRFLENLSWQQVADRIGGGNTEDSVRMAFNRFMKKELNFKLAENESCSICSEKI